MFNESVQQNRFRCSKKFFCLIRIDGSIAAFRNISVTNPMLRLFGILTILKILISNSYKHILSALTDFLRNVLSNKRRFWVIPWWIDTDWFVHVHMRKWEFNSFSDFLFLRIQSTNIGISNVWLILYQLFGVLIYCNLWLSEINESVIYDLSENRLSRNRTGPE